MCDRTNVAEPQTQQNPSELAQWSDFPMIRKENSSLLCCYIPNLAQD